VSGRGFVIFCAQSFFQSQVASTRAIRTALPSARATRETVDNRTSWAWFSRREMADFLVLVIRASVSWVNGSFSPVQIFWLRVRRAASLR
jgi:hypothetical protein